MDLHTPFAMMILTRGSAKITLDDAVQHLHHFCANLPTASYVDRAPIFTFGDNSSIQRTKSIVANVALPISVDSSIRRANGRFRWITEKMAKRDAAFEAYKALYHAGLIDKHLLPLGHADKEVDDAYSAVEKRPSLVEVSEQSNPWSVVACEWQRPAALHGSKVRIMDGSAICAEMVLLLPRNLPRIADFELAWNGDTRFKIILQENIRSFSPTVISQAAHSTSLILKSVFRGRMHDQRDFLYLFVPCHTEDFGIWSQTHEGSTNVDALWRKRTEDFGLVRDMSRNGVPYFLRGVHLVRTNSMAQDLDTQDCEGTEGNIDSLDIIGKSFSTNFDGGKQGASRDGLIDRMEIDEEHRPSVDIQLEVSRVPRRLNHLHMSRDQDVRVEKETKPKMLRAKDCQVDRLPAKFALFATLIPSIMHKVQIAMVRDQLCETVLYSLHFKDRDVVTAAISASSAAEATDYQRLEFWGDSLLKFYTSLTLTARFLRYHEGILAHKKDHIVSNSSLATAAKRKDLDQYILTQPFTGDKWRPLYCDDLLETPTNGRREMSSKTLADVIEALLYVLHSHFLSAHILHLRPSRDPYFHELFSISQLGPIQLTSIRSLTAAPLSWMGIMMEHLLSCTSSYPMFPGFHHPKVV